MPYKNNSRRAAITRIVFLASAIICGSTSAAEIGAQFRAGYIVTDNVFLEPIDTTSDSIWTLGANLRIFEQTNRRLVDIRAIATHQQYSDSFDGETYGSLDAVLDFELIEDRLMWIVVDNYGQRLPNLLAQPTPENRENINFLTTGPTLNLPFNNRFSVAIEGRYGAVNYEDTPNDNERVSGLISLTRQSNANASVSMNVGTTSVEYSDRINLNEFDVHEAFASYQVESVRNAIQIDAGYTELDLGTSSSDGFLLRADWTRTLSGAGEFRLIGGSQYSTQGDIFRLLQNNTIEIGETSDINEEDRPFRSNFALARYSVARERTQFSIELNWRQDDLQYETPVAVALDRDISGFSVRFRRDMTRRTYLNFDVDIINRSYKYLDSEDDDLRVGMTYGYRVLDALNMYVSYQYFDRNSNDVFREFTENRGLFGIEYTPPWGRSSRR